MFNHTETPHGSFS